MHDAGGDRSETIAALPAIIAGLRKRGLHPVTIPRLMLDDPPPRGRPIPHQPPGLTGCLVAELHGLHDQHTTATTR